MNAIDLQGHRGARGWRPENTLPAFEYALAAGVTTLELDIGVTRDGVVVVHHDRRLNPAVARTPDGAWVRQPTPPVWSLSLQELRSYDVGRLDPASPYARRFPLQEPRDGTRVPTLDELFARVQALGDGRVRFNIETKVDPTHPAETAAPEAMTRALVASIRANGCAGRATVQSFDWRTLRLVQEEAAEIATVYLTSEQAGEDTVSAAGGKCSPWTAGFDARDFASVVHMVHAAGGRIWSPDFKDVTPAKVKAAADMSIAIVVWTINEEQDLERALDLGVDGVISDYPDRAAAAIRRRGLVVRGHKL
jgi:glycerophosphoryl diester phosphodiesterase